MSGKRISCICTGLLCCAMSMTWFAQQTFAQAVSLNQSDPEAEYQAQKKLNFIYENFGASEINDAIEKLGSNDTDALFDYFQLTFAAPEDVADPRGPGITNETCGAATAISIGASINANNTGATTDPPAGTCSVGSVPAVNGDLWYSVVGDGNTLTASTCVPTNTLDTVIHVYCDCLDFVCVGGNDTGGGAGCPNDASTFSWCTQSGQTYYIRVGSWSTTTRGAFTLNVTTNGTACASPVNCTPPTRRCCYLNAGVGACTETTFSGCAALSGTWGTATQTTCAGFPCPLGRCCYQSGGASLCTAVQQLECTTTLGGIWVSSPTNCTGANACPVGRCCYMDSGTPTCVDSLNQDHCRDLNGDWFSGQTCVSRPCFANDYCEIATAITTLPYSVSPDNSTAGGSFKAGLGTGCNSSTAIQMQNDIWYKYTPAADCTLAFSANTPAYDSTFAVYTGADCSSLTQVACADAEPHNYNVAAVAGTTYWFQVGKWGSTVGTAGITNVTLNCIIGGACCHADGTCTDNIPAASCNAAGDYYRGDGTNCTVPCSGGCCHADGTCTPATPIASCNATGDVYRGDGSNCTAPCIGACCTAGVCADGVSQYDCTNGGGNYVGDGTSCATALCNDTCAGALTISNGLTPYNTTNATTDGPSISSATCDFTSQFAKNIWYKYTATCNGFLTVDTCEELGGSAAYDTRLAIFNTADCNNVSQATLLGCDDDYGASACGTSTGGYHSAVVGVPVVSGNVYLITVGGYFSSNASGAGTLHIVCEQGGACCHSNGTCTQAINAAACAAVGDVFRGDGSDCGTAGICEVGACCHADESCTIVAGPAQCAAVGDTYLGDTSTCTPGICSTGACCRFDGTCDDDVLAVDCDALNGDSYLGNGSTCALNGTHCSGRCCYYSPLPFILEACIESNQLYCEVNLGGIWTADIDCTTPCPIARCCLAGTCNDWSEAHCIDAGGTWYEGDLCSGTECQIPANDTCETATPIGCDETVNGTSFYANDDYTFTSAGCSGFDSEGPDVAYSFSTPVERDVTIVMDPVTNDLGLYVVTDCADAEGTCVVGSDSFIEGAPETVTFTATAGQTYYIIVDTFGLSGDPTPGDDFSLSVDCSFPACGSCPADMDGNGRLNGNDIDEFVNCYVNSVLGIPGAECGCADMDGDEDVDGDDVNLFANRLVQFGAENKLCPPGLGRCCEDNGSVCTDNVTLYECNALGGSFTAGSTCAEPCPTLADECIDANLLPVPGSVTFDNTAMTPATHVNEGLTCGTTLGTSHTAWFKVIGTGNTIRATTCGGATEVDTIVRVYCGDCSDLVCVGGNDDSTLYTPDTDCDLPVNPFQASTFDWCSASGTTYYIVVGCYSTTTNANPEAGIIELTVTDDGTPCASPPSCTPPIGRCCYLDAGIGTCADNTQGQCNALSGLWTSGSSCGGTPCPIGRCCYNGGNSCADNMQVECNALSGLWTTGLNCTDNPCPILPANDDCGTATVISTVPYVTVFNNDVATADGAPGSCNSATTMQNAVWFKYTPTENCLLSFSVNPNPTFYDAVGLVWSGPDCNTLTQVGACLDAQPMTGSFNATAGTTYWWQLGDWGSTEGGGQTDFSVDCVGGPDVCIPAGADCWATPCGSDTSFSDTPIPADFFGPGSDPFDGTVTLGGASGGFGQDTVIQRLGDLCFPAAVPPSATDSVPIQLVQLNLVSCQPITVTYNGGQNPETWDVVVGLSVVPAPNGTMTVTKVNATGGTFDSVINVQPKFTFNKVGGGGTAILDTGLVPLPPIQIGSTGAPWTTNPVSGGGCDPNFHPGYRNDPVPCCQEVCHSSFGTAPHEHCVISPECSPQCPPDGGEACVNASPINCGDVVAATLLGAANDYDPTSAGCTGYAAVGPDKVFKLRTTVNTSVTVNMAPSPDFDASLYVVTDCADLLGTCVDGSDSNVTAPSDETVTFAATAGVDYYIICDKYGSGGGGPFTISVTCVP